MRYLLDAVRAMAATFRGALLEPTTEQFPKEIRPRPERYRASFALVHDEHGDEACIGCLACERICPSRVISLKPSPKRESPATGKKRGWCEDFTLDLNACIFCELCVQVCPVDAIVMLRQKEEPAFAREDLILTMDKLYANEKLKTATWGTGTRLMDAQEPPKVDRSATAPPPADAPKEGTPTTPSAPAGGPAG